MKKYIIAVFTVPLLWACEEDYGVSYEPPVFPEEKEVSIHVLADDMPIAGAYRIILCDSVAVIEAQSLKDKTQFQVLSLDNGEHLGGFGYVGRGSGELTSYSLYNIDRRDNTLLATDTNGKMMRIDLAKAISGDRFNVVETYDMPKFVTGRLMYCCSDNRLLLLQGVPRFHITDLSGRDTLSVYRGVPKITPEIDKDTVRRFQYLTYDSELGVKPDETRFFNATAKGMFLEIFEINDNEIVPYTIRYFYPTKISHSIKATEDCIWGALQADATEEYIYILYRDTPIRNYRNVTKAILGIFDWDGKEVCKYTFDKSVYIVAPTSDDIRG